MASDVFSVHDTGVRKRAFNEAAEAVRMNCVRESMAIVKGFPGITETALESFVRITTETAIQIIERRNP